MEAPFRLHISGLAPTTKPKDLVSRFTSFGTIVGGDEGVGGLGVDANGFPRTFAFVTLETTQAKLAKCTSMLSGSMWKGHKLRIALAKPDYHSKMAAEREAIQNGTAKGPKRKKRKPNPDPNVGELARHWELITAENAKRHSVCFNLRVSSHMSLPKYLQGWTVDANPTPAPLFPLLTRPSHPLPALPSKAPATSWTRETLRAKGFREKKEARRLAAPPVPILRARRVRIDVRKWGRTKRVFTEEDRSAGKKWEIKGAWECVESDDEEEESSKKVRKEDEATWVFRAPDGSVRRVETIRLGRKDAYTDSFKASLEALAGPVTDIPAPAAPKPKYAIDIPGELDHNPVERRAKSLSPPPYIPLAPRTLLYNEEDAFALKTTTLDENEAAESREIERLAQLEVLKGLIGADEEAEVVPAASTGTKRSMPAVEGFGDEDDEEAFQEVLRLRGGGSGHYFEEEPSGVLRLRGGAEEESDEEDSDSETEDAEMKVDEATSSKTKLSMGTLKDMFKPQEATSSFSLLTGLDLELDPVERTPSPEPTQFPTYRPFAPIAGPRGSFVPPPALGGHNRAWIGTGPLTPFFPFPIGKFEAKDGSVNMDVIAKMGLPVELVENAARESAKRLGEGAQSFWKMESAEKIEEEHQKLRESLRGHARKRHREASKRGRKKTAGRRVGGGGNEGATLE
ncbi:nucleolar protein 8, partial [Phenoliferia sp. Uapishka_3]